MQEKFSTHHDCLHSLSTSPLYNEHMFISQEQTERVKDAAPDEKELKKLEKNVDKLKESFDAAAENANKVEEEVHR